MRLRLPLVLERKHPDLAAFVVVPASAVAPWGLDGTTTVEGTVDGVALGRRSLLRWDADRWFVELRRETLTAIGKAPGETVALELWVASTELPDELVRLLQEDAAAKARWDALTAAQRRSLREEILGARTAGTRERRARKALVPAPGPARPPADGLPTAPTPLLVRVVGSRLPGRACGPYTDIHVGMPQGGETFDTVPADRPVVTFEARLAVFAQDGAARFRGPAVNGPPTGRFLYLTWFGRKGDAPAAMFRRAKLRLDAVPADVLAEALRAGTLVGELELTDHAGMPLCASVLPPAIRWRRGGAPGAA